MMEDRLYNTRDFDFFASLIAPSLKNEKEEEIAHKLLTKYLTIENALSADENELISCVGESCAAFLKLAAAIISRRKTDAFAFGKRHTKAEIADYFKALFLGFAVETVYAMTFDERGRAVSCEQVSSGIVNVSEIIPRRLVEIAYRANAKAIVIAHNHPRGKARPSDEDVAQTNMLAKMLFEAGVELREHYIIAGQRCFVFSPNDRILKYEKEV